MQVNIGKYIWAKGCQHFKNNVVDTNLNLAENINEVLKLMNGMLTI